MKRSMWVIIVLVCIFALLINNPVYAQKQSTGEITFTIMHTNDEHSALLPHPFDQKESNEDGVSFVGGFARLSSAIKQMEHRIDDDDIFLMSAGDFMGGSPFSWLALENKAVELKLMQNMGYDAVLLGNHEYDYGPNALADYLANAGYPEAHKKTQVLSGNAAFPSGHPMIQMQPSRYIVQEMADGTTIGIFGLMGEDAVSVAPNAEPVVFEDQHDFANKAVASLQHADADIIVALTHSGLDEDRKLAEKVPEIDLIVGGHCHTALDEPEIVEDTIIAQAGSNAEYLGILQLSYDINSENLSLRNHETELPFLRLIDDSIIPDEEIAQKLDTFRQDLDDLLERITDDSYGEINEVIAYSDEKISDSPPKAESPYGNLVADAFRFSAQEVMDKPVNFAIQANGQIRGALVPREDGTINLYDIASTVGLGMGPLNSPGYPLISLYLTGDEMRRVLEIGQLLPSIMGNAFQLQVSGLRFEYDRDRASLFQIPVIDQPLPTYRAVIDAEMIEFPKRHVNFDKEPSLAPLAWSDDTLYHVVVDSFVASFVPQVGDMLPRLKVEPKNEFGEPITSLNEHIIYIDSEPLTAWRAVAEYVGNMSRPDDGIPEISPYYFDIQDRQKQVDTLPFLFWPISTGLIVGAVIIYYVIAIRKND